MEEKIHKRKKIIKIVSLVISIVLVIGISYAYFITEEETGEQTTTVGNLDLTFTESTVLRLTNAIPLRDEDVENSASEIPFLITNTGTVNIYTSINLDSVTMSDALKIYDFKWALYEGDNKVTTGDFSSGASSYNLANNLLIRPSETNRYMVRIWVSSSSLDQSTLSASTFSATVSAKGYSSELRTLSNRILAHNNVVTTSPTFSAESEDLGLFVQQNNFEKSEMGFPTYYYKGGVSNNYVEFGTYASSGSYTSYDNAQVELNTFSYTSGEPIIWRIVRINEDGSVKLISQNLVGSKMIWTSNTEAKYVNDDGTNSEIKTTLEEWYNTNIGSNTALDSKVVSSSFCNDISNNYGALTRISSTQPIFTCPDGAITTNSKVGMITADEAVYAGTILNNTNMINLSYLMNGYLAWTITPSANNRAFYIGEDMSGTELYTNDISSDWAIGVRAVINISADAIVKSGNGTSTNPYKIR